MFCTCSSHLVLMGFKYMIYKFCVFADIRNNHNYCILYINCTDNNYMYMYKCTLKMYTMFLISCRDTPYCIIYYSDWVCTAVVNNDVMIDLRG